MIDPLKITQEIPGGLWSKYPAISYDNILLAYRGSIAHGTYEPNSSPQSIDDIDLMGVAVPGIEHYFGLSKYGSRGTVEITSDPYDIVVYEARKAIDLLMRANPNILSLLWLPDDMYVRLEPAGQLLVERRELFATQAAYNPFVGYARSQLMKMERGTCEGYMGEKRKRLVEKYGYDTKNAAHLIRILRMGVEFLTWGEMRVDRREIDADELLEIKHGALELEDVKAKAEYLFRLAEAAKERSKLRERPNRLMVNELCVDVVSLAQPAL